MDHRQVSEEAGFGIFKNYFSTFIREHMAEVHARIVSQPQSRFIIFWKGTSVQEKKDYSFTIEEKPAHIKNDDRIRNKVYQDQTCYRIFIQPQFRDFNLFFVVDLNIYFQLQTLQGPILDFILEDIEDWAPGINELKEEVKKGRKFEEFFALGYWENACKLPTNDFHDVQPLFIDIDCFSKKYSDQVCELASDNDFYKEDIKTIIKSENPLGLLAFRQGTDILLGFCLYSTSFFGAMRTVELEYQLIDKEYQGKSAGAALVDRLITTIKFQFPHDNIRIVVESKQNKETKRFWLANNFPVNDNGFGEIIINSLLEEKLDPKEFGLCADDNSDRLEEKFEIKKFVLFPDDNSDTLEEKLDPKQFGFCADDKSVRMNETEIDSLDSI